MIDADLAKGVDVTTWGCTSPNWRILHLTSADFADAARDESFWRKATGIAREKAGTVTVDLMKQILISLIKHSLNL